MFFLLCATTYADTHIFPQPLIPHCLETEQENNILITTLMGPNPYQVILFTHKQVGIKHQNTHMRFFLIMTTNMAVKVEELFLLYDTTYANVESSMHWLA